MLVCADPTVTIPMAMATATPTPEVIMAGTTSRNGHLAQTCRGLIVEVDRKAVFLGNDITQIW